MVKPSSLSTLFPAGTKVLLSGTGREFIERIGVEAVRGLRRKFKGCSGGTDDAPPK